MSRPIVRGLVGATLFAALGLVVLLARQNGALAERATRLERRAFEPYPGMWVPTVTATTLDGAPLVVGERTDGARQLLFVFSTTCPYCEASLPAWREIATAAAAPPEPRTVVTGIVVDSGDADAYRRAHGFGFPVARFPSAKARSMYRMRSVPLVLLLDAEGRVLYSRTGVLRDRTATDSVLAAVRWTPPRRSGNATGPMQQRSER